MKEFSTELSQKIDSYLLGDMSAVESTQFETEIASDVDLRSEVDFQQDLINQIQNKEILRIKNHLNTLDVTSTSVFLQTKAFVTYAAVALITASVGVYSLYTQFDDNPNTIAQSHDLSVEHINYYENKVNEITAEESIVKKDIASEETKTVNISNNKTEVNYEDVNVGSLNAEINGESSISTNDAEGGNFNAVSFSKKTSDTSNIFVMQDSDDFSPNRRLYIHKEHFKNKDCVLSSFTKGIFYNIHTKQVMIYNYRNKRSYNLLHAVRPSYIKNIKDPKVYRLIFSNFFLKIKPENIYKDYTIDKDNWKTGLFTDGYNTISVSRRRLYNNPSNGFIRCNKKVLLNYPKYLFNFI